jgi:uncharacterized membrane protein YfcA
MEFSSAVDAVLLFAAALAAGALNSVAGGGSFLTFPSLLFAGVPPVTANATSTVALWPGTVASTGAYWRELAPLRKQLAVLSVISIVGGFIGAKVLLLTSQEAFRALIPWLLLTATAVFAFGNSVVAKLRRPERTASNPHGLGALLAQFPIAVYGGFFGGGIGILMLAALSVSGIQDIHRMNAIKNWLAMCINGIAFATFIVEGAVYWPQAMVMTTGAIVGGFSGVTLAKKVPPANIRGFVVAVGVGMTAYFFVRG